MQNSSIAKDFIYAIGKNCFRDTEFFSGPAAYRTVQLKKQPEYYCLTDKYIPDKHKQAIVYQ